MGWGDVTPERGAGAGGNAAYLKLKDGEAAKIHVIDEEPISFKSTFFKAINRGAVIDPDNNPLAGVKGFDVRSRHAITVFDYTDQTVKVLTGSNRLFNSLKAIYEEYADSGGFSGIDLKITRTGEGFDTQYQVVPTAKCQWDDSMLDGQELPDLSALFSPTPAEVVEQYMQGVDPGTDFDPSKLEAESTEEFPAEETVEDGAEEVAEEEPAPTPAARKPLNTARPTNAVRPNAGTARPQPTRTATPAKAPLGRNELIVKINAAIKNKVRYKKPGTWMADVQKFGGKDKKSMSQLGTDALAKLLAFVNTVK